jgi:hypothetical protein
MSPMGKSDTLAFARSGRMTFSRYETSDLQAKWERAKLQHEKLRALIAANSALETTKQHQLQHLQEKYRGVDFTTIYHLSDLTTMAGINRARQRLDLYGAMTTELDAVVQQYWVDWDVPSIPTTSMSPWPALSEARSPEPSPKSLATTPTGSRLCAVVPPQSPNC